MNKELTQAIAHWQKLARFLLPPTSEATYHKKVKFLDALLDIAGDDETHVLMPLIDLLTKTIAEYEVAYHKAMPVGMGIGALKFLMQEHQLKQKDLHFLGSQGVVSEILSGKRKLNMRHVKALARYFNLSPETFIH